MDRSGASGSKYSRGLGEAGGESEGTPDVEGQSDLAPASPSFDAVKEEGLERCLINECSGATQCRMHIVLHSRGVNASVSSRHHTNESWMVATHVADR
jgi:hypothetical protein